MTCFRLSAYPPKCTNNSRSDTGSHFSASIPPMCTESSVSDTGSRSSVQLPELVKAYSKVMVLGQGGKVPCFQESSHSIVFERPYRKESFTLLVYTFIGL